MGIMACETFPFCKRVMVRAARLRFHEIAMTLSAHLGTAKFQEILLIRSVGLMAGITVRIHDGFMGIGLQKLCFGIGMARITNPVHPVLNNIFDIRTMRIMA